MPFIFVFAAAALGDRLIAARHAVVPAGLGISEKPRENIVKPRKGKRTTGRRKTAVGMG